MMNCKKGLEKSRSNLLYYFNNYDLYLMLLIPIALLLLFKYTPMFGLLIAFKDYDIFAGNNAMDSIFKSSWVGFNNFRMILSSMNFKNLLKNTLLINFYKLVFLFPLPVILAILLNEIRHVYYKKITQTLVYIPHFISWVVVASMFMSILADDGVVNRLITRLGYSTVGFFRTPSIFRGLLVATSGWKETGWNSIIYLAALTSINPELYESSKMDGASKLQQIWHITLPGLLPTITLMFILRMGNILLMDFQQIFTMYNPTVYSVADVFSTYIYRVSLGKMEFSTGTAMGLFNSVVSLSFVLSANALSRKFLNRSIW